MGKQVGSLFVKLGLITDEFDKKIASAQKNLRSFGRRFGDVGGDLTKSITLPLAAVAAAAFKFSTDFNKSMANVATLIPGNSDRIKELKNEVIALSNETAKSTTDLSNALYQTISAFGDTDQTIKILEIAAKSASAGVAETVDSVNLLSAVTKGYGDTSAEAVQKVSDLALLTVRLGQTTFPELASSIGRVVPLSQALKVSQEELFGVLSTATGVTGNAAEVSTQFRGVLQSLLAPTADMTRLFEDLGVKSGASLIEQKGLAESIKIIGQYAEQNNLPLQKLIGSIEGQTLAMALNGSLADQYNQKLQQMSQSAGVTGQAYDEIANGVNKVGFSFEKLQNIAKNALTELGNKMLEVFGEKFANGIEGLSQSLLSVVNGFNSLSPKTQEFLLKMAGLAALVGPLLVGLAGLATFLGGALLIKVVAVTTAVSAMVAAWDTLGLKLPKSASQLDIAKSSLQNLVILLDTAIPGASARMSSLFQRELAKVVSSIESTWTFIKVKFNQLSELLSRVGENIVKTFQLLPQKVDQAFNSLDQIFEKGKKRIGEVGDKFYELYDRVVGNSYVPDMVDGISDEMIRMREVMKTESDEATEHFGDNFKKLEEQIPEKKDLWSSIFGDDVRFQIQNSLAMGITDAFNSGDVAGAIKGFAGSVASAVGSSIAGPVGGALFQVITDSFISIGKSVSKGEQIKGKDQGVLAGATALSTGGLANLGAFALNGFLGDSKEEKARKQVELFLENILGDNLVFGKFTDNFSAAFDQIAGDGRESFTVLGEYITELAGVSEGVGEQIGFIFSQNVGGSIDEARLLMQELGFSAQDVEEQFVELGREGDLSWHAIEVKLQAVNKLTGDGLVAFGDVVGVLEQVRATGGAGIDTLIGLRNFAVEAGEKGAENISDLRNELIAAGASIEDADRIFNAFSGRGIITLEQLRNASDRTLGGVAADLESLGFQWGEDLTGKVDETVNALDKLDKKLNNINKEVDLKINVKYNEKNQLSDGVVANALGNVFTSSGIQKFAKGGIFSDATLFRHPKGLGILGEGVKDEAILPLTRMSNGELGISALGGGQSPTIIYNIDARGAQQGVEAAIIEAMKLTYDRSVKDAVSISRDLSRRGL